MIKTAMENYTGLFNNTLEMEMSFDNRMKFGLSALPCLVFVYINGVMLITLRSEEAFRETPRYILFGHMLFADSLQLLWSLLSYIIATIQVYMSNGLCAVILSVANVTVRISPLNLAVMSLERYSAICFPLRHAEIATAQRTTVAIALIWVLGSLNALVEFLLFLTMGPPFVRTQVYCLRSTLFEMSVYVEVNKGFTSVYLVSVAVIIVYTYVAIVVEARSVSSDKISAHRARNTVLLHFIQLGLCLSSFLIGFLNMLAARLDTRTSANVRYVIFLLLVIFPRCLSPLIYGLRDNTFRPLLGYYFSMGLGKRKVKPVA